MRAATAIGEPFATGIRLRLLIRRAAKGRVLRGTPLDPFGRAEVRRVEHVALVERLTTDLALATYERSVQLASASEQVRGYEGVKLAAVGRCRAAVR